MLSAIALPVIIGLVSLVAEFGHGLLTKVEEQRVADIAAYAGAVAYGTSASTTTMVAAAQRVASLNGIPSSAVTVTLGTSPRTPVNQAVQVTIRTNPVLLLAPVVRSGASLAISASSFAELGAATPACVLAMSASGTGVTLAAGPAITAPACTVSSNASVSVPCGTTIAAKSVTYNGALPTQPCQGIAGSPLKTVTADPLATNVGIGAIASHNAIVASLAGPATPAVATGFDIDFGYIVANTVAQALLAGCIATPQLLGIPWTLYCPPGGTYRFNNITVLPGLTVNFNIGATSSTSYTVSGSVTNFGAVLNFGPGSYTIAKGIRNQSGATTAFAASTVAIGPLASACNGASTYSLCNLGTATFAGPSAISLSAGLYNNAGSTLTLGTATGNTLQIGAAADGNAILAGSGATTLLGATDANAFQIAGNVTLGAGCTSFGNASQHDIRGNLTAAGGVTLGTGVYTTTGYIAVGVGGGSDVTCNGTPVGLTGTGVTLVTQGLATVLGTSCNGMSFCLGSGFSNVALSAPTTGPTNALAIVGPLTSSRTGGILLTEGSTSTTLSGAIYVPQGALTLAGSVAVGNGVGQCLTLIGSQVTLTGSTRASAGSCFAASATAAPALIQ